ETSSQIPEDQSNRAEQNSISNLESQASDQSNWNEQSQAAQGAEIQSDANQNVPSSQAQDNTQASEEIEQPQMPEGFGKDGEGGGMFGPGGGGMHFGSDAVKLLYSDEEIDSYADIFDNKVMDVTNADKKRLIASIKQLNEGENISEVVETDEVIRYFVAHNFVLNGDSYTGMMVHNYYLREKDGKMSMIAWDYNLAFRSEEHTSELQSRFDLVCRLLLEKKKYLKKNKSGELKRLSENHACTENSGLMSSAIHLHMWVEM